MLRKLLCLSLLFLGTLAAEQIDNIEFQLPELPQEWSCVQQVENDYGASLVYVSDDEDSMDFFCANLLHIPYVSTIDPDQLGQWLNVAFPFINFKLNLLDKNDDSSTIEFFGLADDELVLYGLIRQMRAENGTVTLSFVTDEDGDFEQVQTYWLPAIQSARVAN